IRQLIIASAFTGRLAGINPNMPDEELDNITSEYQLIQIMPTKPHTDPGGVDERSWVWPFTTTLLLLLLFFRRKC
ncbi:MAG: hypothetical protein MUO64_18055, partial [Anaerolineales bacterium]|nr:hypothetical protein [Anaerolineales bacterium]